MVRDDLHATVIRYREQVKQIGNYILHGYVIFFELLVKSGDLDNAQLTMHKERKA